MSRRKIDFGIDLGTTNSAIAVFDNGEAKIIKSDVMKDTIPSCVSKSRRGVVSGDQAMNLYRKDVIRLSRGESAQSSSFIEFKRVMGTDTVFKTSDDATLTPEELSAEVLRKLKSFGQNESLKSVVITVPAKFTINQKDSTTAASKLAGFEDCFLLQEPIAAAMAYGADGKGTDGWWLVFDFGGGTFDAALLEVTDGIISVRDTEGDNYLGGKNLDYAVVDELLLPYLEKTFKIKSLLADSKAKETLRNTLKLSGETIKNQLSFVESYSHLTEPDELPADDDGVDMELDITLTRGELKSALGPIFQKAIDICKQLLDRNNLGGDDLASLILVGGPTFSPIVREMLKEQITQKIDTSIDPMTAVARGAAIYASTVDVSESLIAENRDVAKLQMKIDYEPTTVETCELVTIKLDETQNSAAVPSVLFLEVVRGDKGWSSGRLDFNRAGEVVDVQLEEGKSNTFQINLYDDKGDSVPCEPSSINILQGVRVGSATLPYSLGVGIQSIKKGFAVVTGITGLEKNKSLPAVGTISGLKTQQDIRPGVAQDVLKIPIYEIEFGADGTRLINNQHVFDTVLTGEAFPALLPKDSEIELTVKCSSDGSITVSAYFPSLDLTEEVVRSTHSREGVSAEWLREELQRAGKRTDVILSNEHITDIAGVNSISEGVRELEQLLESGSENADTRMQILENLRKLSQQIDKAEDDLKWPAVEKELTDAFYDLKDLCEKVKQIPDVDQTKIARMLADFEKQVPEVIKTRNVTLAETLEEKISTAAFNIRDEAMGVQFEIGYLNYWNDNFDSLHWANRGQARQLLDQGLRMIAAGNPSKSALRSIVVEVSRLLPRDEAQRAEVDDTLLGG
jgi:molecular chaperone DnaK